MNYTRILRALMVSCGLLAGTGAMKEAPAAPSEQEADVAIAQTAVAPHDLPDVGVAVVPNLFEGAETIAINPKNASQLVAGIDIRDAYYGQGRGCAIKRSLDGGGTWSAPVMLPRPQGRTTPNSCYKSPAVAYAADGKRVFAAYQVVELSDPETNSDIETSSDIVVAVSEDGGGSWQMPTEAIGRRPGESGEAGYYFYNIKLAVALEDPDRLYVIAHREDITSGGHLTELMFSRSSDGGRTWSAAEVLVTGNYEGPYLLGSSIAGGRDGEVMVAWGWAEFYNGTPKQIRIMRSRNFGATFAAPVVAVNDNASADVNTPDVAFGFAGAAHIVYRRRPNATPVYSVRYTYSGHAYQRWSAPVTIGRSAAVGFFSEARPELAIERCGASSLLHVLWPDDRMVPQGRRSGKDLSLYYSRKLASSGSAWSKPLRISDESPPGLWDSTAVADLAAAGGNVFAIWSDVRGNPNRPTTLRSNVLGSAVNSGVTCP